MKAPTLDTRAYWVAVKGLHALSQDTSTPPNRFKALIYCRNYARLPCATRNGTRDDVIRVVESGEARYGPHTKGDRTRLDYRVHRLTVDRFAELYRAGKHDEATRLLTGV